MGTENSVRGYGLWCNAEVPGAHLPGLAAVKHSVTHVRRGRVKLKPAMTTEDRFKTTVYPAWTKRDRAESVG